MEVKIVEERIIELILNFAVFNVKEIIAFLLNIKVRRWSKGIMKMEPNNIAICILCAIFILTAAWSFIIVHGIVNAAE